MPSRMERKGGILTNGEAFRYFLWRKVVNSSALKGFVPDILASDGHRVRRLTVGDHFLSMQHYDDPDGAEAIAQMVEMGASQKAGLRGYSIYTDHDSVAIWHSSNESEPVWAVFPFANLPGSASVLASLPAYGDGGPRLRLCGGARLRWVSGRLVLEAAIEQRSDGFHDAKGTRDLMDHLEGLHLETTVEQAGERTPVRLAGRNAAANDIRRTAPRRVETRWELNASMYEPLRGNPSMRAWFVLTFDSSLFCVPEPWRQWWFEVNFPTQIDM